MRQPATERPRSWSRSSRARCRYMAVTREAYRGGGAGGLGGASEGSVHAVVAERGALGGKWQGEEGPFGNVKWDPLRNP